MTICAHSSYKHHDSEGGASESISWQEHVCDVCGQTCTDALQLLAHAEGHARSEPKYVTREKRTPCLIRKNKNGCAGEWTHGRS